MVYQSNTRFYLFQKRHFNAGDTFATFEYWMTCLKCTGRIIEAGAFYSKYPITDTKESKNFLSSVTFGEATQARSYHETDNENVQLDMTMFIEMNVITAIKEGKV